MSRLNSGVGSNTNSSSQVTNAAYILQQVNAYTVVEFRNPSLMDPVELEQIAQGLYKLVDEHDKRKIVLDTTKVQFMSSQAIGIVLGLYKRLTALKNSKLILCGVGPTLAQLLRITRLDTMLTIKPTQKEAVNVV